MLGRLPLHFEFLVYAEDCGLVAGRGLSASLAATGGLHRGGRYLGIEPGFVYMDRASWATIDVLETHVVVHARFDGGDFVAGWRFNEKAASGFVLPADCP